MKTIFRFIIAAMAAISVFSSCQKEQANETANSTSDGVRTISVQFDNSTKASLSGLIPTFTNNDEIRVSNDTESEECTVTVSGAGATFTTTLSGALTAIYPADAAVLASEAADAPIATSNNFKVLATQDGTVEKAIIASATVAEGENTTTFNVLTALFEITPPDDVTTFTIKSLKPVVDGVARTGDAVAINTEGADAAAKRVITVTVPSGGDGKAYVALVPGVNLTDLSFEYSTDETQGAMKGIPTKGITAAGKTDATAANTKYTINSQNWHPYVKIQMTINGDPKTYKWATMNIGANSTTEYGYYFFWGGTVGYKRNGSKWVKADVTPEEELTNGFVQANDPHYSGSAYTKYTGTSGDKTVLELADDAATANWGGSWRMPTKEEFDALCSLTKEWKTDYKDSGVKGYEFTDANSNSIFLPAAGCGNGTGLSNEGDDGDYWSSSLRTASPNYAYYLYFDEDDADPSSFRRYYGHPVRALSE